ncbi:MAG: hypothetical protein C0592_10930 [Marinilabiliales bacterium]|nr:MAG: hypothetical protein C0592_10930 [Marinilabiliales bacterium]
MRTVIFLAFVFPVLSSIAQVQVESYKMQAHKLIKAFPSSETGYDVSVIHKPLNPNNESSNLENKSKNGLELQGRSNFRSTTEVQEPIIQYAWEDIHDDYWVPNDNTMAISNDGYMITMQNSRLAFYDPSHQEILSQKLNDFTDSLGLPETKYDPRLLYDYEQDRFVTVMLAGYEHTSSQIVIGFSGSSNPTDEWSFYTVPGNILGDSSWSDFPSIALSNEELFITVTNFDDYLTETYWKFTGCRILQVNKMQGYNGDSIVDYTYHFINPGFGASIPSDVYYYNVIPVRGGDTLYGPDMYFVSTLDCGFPDSTGGFAPNDTVFLVKFNGNQYDTGFSIESHLLQSPINYGMSGATPQPYGLELKTNYNTILDAVLCNNKIHFMLNSIDYSNGMAGIYHGTIADPDGSKTLTATMISYDTLGIAFPSFEWVGDSPGDEKYIIGFNYAAANTYAGNACILYDNGNYSNMKILKEGNTVMNFGGSNAQRWGDYTCMQKKHNEPQFIFFVGSYGEYYNSRTWISKLTLDSAYLAINEPTMSSGKIYPVPASERIQVAFSISKPQICSFFIYSFGGELSDEIHTEMIESGENKVSFDISTLPEGNYILVIAGEDGYEFTKKFQVIH